MWKDRQYYWGQTIEIEIGHNAGWSVTMELTADSTEQIYVRPKVEVRADTLRETGSRGWSMCPPMTGLETDERALSARGCRANPRS